MIAYHYSNNELKIGDKIISQQHNFQTYDLVWRQFKKLCDFLPNQFGYAYPIKKDKRSFKFLYIVETNFCITGNFNYSVFVTMAKLSSATFANKTIPLKERLKMRENWLGYQGKNYFSETSDINQVELISENWVVKSIVNL